MKFVIHEFNEEGIIHLNPKLLKALKLKVGDIVDVEMCKDQKAMDILEAKPRGKNGLD
jgi:ribosomal 50S subunit-recycling heat shock protein